MNSWLLKESKGASLFDNCILVFLKIIYFCLRISLRITLGKKRRDSLLGVWTFGLLLYKATKVLGLGKSRLLKIKVPKYDYKVYCGITKEDFIIMTRHEDEIIEKFSPKGGDIVVDVGAHMGRYTIIASKRVGQNGNVIAIEPHPGNFEMLNRNIKLNGLTNIIPMNYAVYSKETKIKLYLPGGELGYALFNTITLNRAKNKEKFVEVDANTLDNILQENGIRQEGVNWIKIDVEGAEFEVLKGAHSILSKSKDITLLIEVHGDPHVYRPKVEKLLDSYNFKIDFEKSYWNGEMHILLSKKHKVDSTITSNMSSNNTGL
jgi:FkbM family methyltransferase